MKKYGDRDTHFIRAVINSTIELDTVSFTNTFIKELQICYFKLQKWVYIKRRYSIILKLIDYYNDALYTAGKYQESLTLLTKLSILIIHKLKKSILSCLLFFFFQRLLYASILNPIYFRADSVLWHQNDKFEYENNGIYKEYMNCWYRWLTFIRT